MANLALKTKEPQEKGQAVVGEFHKWRNSNLGKELSCPGLLWKGISCVALLPYPWGIFPCHEWIPATSLEFMWCYLHNLEGTQGRVSPTESKEHTGVRFAMKERKKNTAQYLWCTIFFYSSLALEILNCQRKDITCKDEIIFSSALLVYSCASNLA